MSLQETKNSVLLALFEGYSENPNGIYDLTGTITENGEDPHELGKYLVDHGWVKNQQYRPSTFVCQITMAGINEVAPEYIQDKTEQIISTLGINGGKESVMGILEFEPKDFQKAFDLVKHMEGTGFIKEGRYMAGDIIIELSLEGREYYEEHKPNFLDLK